ncbi:MAG: hypothetical protein SGPRY_010326 [Prymnesium sp.]
MSATAVTLAAGSLTAALQLTGFGVAYALQTEVFYDIVGGINFLGVAALSAYHAPNWADDERKRGATLLFATSRCWLLLFLAWRAHERKGDSRFDGVKHVFSTFLLFWVAQGMWVFIISSPLLFVNASSVSRPMTTYDLLLLASFGNGVLFEVLADIQKASWVKKGRQGGFCDVGLWSFSRHPNYFGEMLQWWSLWLFAYRSSAGIYDLYWWATCLSPLFTMHILMNIPSTGLTRANGKHLKRYYDRCPKAYANYRASTSILLPMVGYKHVPIFLKRTLFLDFERYEYRPRKEDKDS